MALPSHLQILLFILFAYFIHVNKAGGLPIVITTWTFKNATEAAWGELVKGRASIDALEFGVTKCEFEQCDHTVGFGGHTDEAGETTLDAMIMDGITHDVGAVGCLRNVKNAIGVARAVMDYTEQSLLVGDFATDFAVSMGFPKEDLHTNRSIEEYRQWKNGECQPNFRLNVVPDPTKSCGPYKPKSQNEVLNLSKRAFRYDKKVAASNHDTIGMVVIDGKQNVAAGTSTNGLNHKVPGRVGDSPIMGAGAYCDNEYGGASATGDGDVMMRFLPSFNAVFLLSMGVSPKEAAERSIRPIIKYYPSFSGAVIVVDIKGNYGAACHGLQSFPFVVENPSLPNATVMTVPCI